MKFTGEFFIPNDEASNNGYGELEIEHKQRYLSILDLVEGKIVLDIASGEGYGTSLLSSKAKHVTGIDINPELVQHAGEKYASGKIRFLHGSVAEIPLESGSVDVIVSFETLEHVEAPVQELFFKEAKRVLRPDGVFIVSTPNKKNYTDRYDHQNKFHVHELYENELEEALKGHFNYVQIYDQGLEVSSVILNKDHYLSQKPVKTISVNNAFQFEGKYLIALCSDLSQSLQTPIASMVPESEKSYFQLIDRILDLQKEVEQLGAWGTRSAAEVEDLLKERAALIEERTAQLDLARQDILRQDQIIEKLQRDLARSNHEKFLIEAELEAVREINAQRQLYHSDMVTITDSITDLTDTISKREVNRTSQQVPAVSSSLPSGAIPSTPEDFPRQIAKLQEHIQWYKKTYEERSFLGLIKQGIRLRFRK